MVCMQHTKENQPSACDQCWWGVWSEQSCPTLWCYIRCTSVTIPTSVSQRWHAHCSLSVMYNFHNYWFNSAQLVFWFRRALRILFWVKVSGSRRKLCGVLSLRIQLVCHEKVKRWVIFCSWDLCMNFPLMLWHCWLIDRKGVSLINNLIQLFSKSFFFWKIIELLEKRKLVRIWKNSACMCSLNFVRTLLQH